MSFQVIVTRLTRYEKAFGFSVFIALACVSMVSFVFGSQGFRSYSWHTVQPKPAIKTNLVQAGLKRGCTMDDFGPEEGPSYDFDFNRKQIPSYLQGKLPRNAQHLAIHRVQSVGTNLSLVAWSDDQCFNNLALLKRKGGSSVLTWTHRDPDHYCPQIRILRGSNFNGRQVYFEFSQGGAAWQIAQPLCVNGEKVELLPRIDTEEVFSIRLFPDGVTRLIGYHRECPYRAGGRPTLETPTIYEWTGTKFEKATRLNLSYFTVLLQEVNGRSPFSRAENPDLFKEECSPERLYLEAGVLVEAGYYREASSLLDQICESVKVSKDASLIVDYQSLRHKLRVASNSELPKIAR